MVTTVFFDFGGVLLTSPFEAFARYERDAGLPVDAIRRINSTDPDTNAWAQLERNEIGVDDFVAAFEAEALAHGVELDGATVVACLHGQLRPAMVTALRRCSEQFTTGLLTNNFVTGTPEWSSGGSFADLLDHFDVVVESSVVGTRKPERRFYEVALERAGAAASDVVFLDDLGINLKPAREMGMTTIKVTDPTEAIAELEAVLGIDLR